ncbi:hypothetical protein SmJEL517_g04572 [Synchytrium microbalum]|uniref:Nephrocystin 3-like N-terminal domain-containing protein n=1 Tax=Synchytrium microbalum TaxID=1806994 RepID=A0A507BYT9_9FUNG|nr:uncharacterized protein SmJEL517_g04572 [Synchytrium microbalum]TPX32281.1 hypothetical protein SmJEL517_g04572 [Synchytrium microbalum]
MAYFADFSLTTFWLKETRLKSTRGWLLDELMEWKDIHNQSCVYWLSGVADVGKSVIAGSFSDQQPNQLAAHFFCKHAEIARNGPLRIIATWAFQLASFDLDIGKASNDIYQAEPNFLINMPSIGRQFEQLIVRPLSKYCGGKAVILLDALNEYVSCENGRIDVVSKRRLDRGRTGLVENGVDINYQSKYLGTAIFAASFYGVEDMVLYLLNNRADSGLGWDAEGIELEGLKLPYVPVEWTPLLVGAVNDLTEMVQLMVEYGEILKEPRQLDFPWIGFWGSDLDDVDVDRVTALHCAIMNKAIQTFEALLELGANVNIADNAGNTPLHEAAKENAANMISLLVKACVAKSNVNKLGMTPFQDAQKAGFTNILQLLK